MKSGNGIQDYIVKVLNGMAQGLFSSLLIGLIIKQIGVIGDFPTLVSFGNVAQSLMGPAIGAGVAYSIGAPPLAIFASLIAGAIGAGSVNFESGAASIAIGEPVGALVAALIGAHMGKLISGKTKVDIVLVPITTILTGGLVGIYIAPYISSFMNGVGGFINMATTLHPIPMGIIISVAMGMILTLPISSAAIAISLNLSGLAAGAATVGCAANMIGFAVISYRENGPGGLIAQGLGTSMLQVPNIIKNPLIWIPAIIASAILGPVSTMILGMKSNATGAGMGTSGLVGQFAVIETMGSTTEVLIQIGLMHFILPAIISLLVAKWMRRANLIKPGDLKL